MNDWEETCPVFRKACMTAYSHDGCRCEACVIAARAYHASYQETKQVQHRLREPPQGPVKCPFCGAEPFEDCINPKGHRCPTHRARIVLSIVGNKSAAAAAVVEKILADALKRQK